jgi:hypothetical protein
VDIQRVQHLVIPLQGVDVEQHGTRGVGVVGDVDASLGHLPDKPGVDGTEQQLAAFCTLA